MDPTDNLNRQLEYYVCVNEKGELMGLDRDSGGYPFIAPNLNWVHFWTKKEDAEKYANIGTKLIVKEFNYNLK
jgi:hypothetical protein